MLQCERQHCSEDFFFFFTKKGNGEYWAKVGKSQSVKEKNNPSVPSEAGGLAGLIQEELYNVFLPFKRLHQCTTVYSLCKHLININVNGAFTKRDKVTWAVFGLTSKRQSWTKTTFKSQGETRIIGKSWDLTNVQIQMSHVGVFGEGGEELALCGTKL